MKTIDTAAIKEAAKIMQEGGVIAYPTEAVYGLGCDPFNADAIARILQIKHRSIDQGFILVAERWEQVEHLVEPISPANLFQVLETWPGPFTWVFPAKANTPQWITGKNEGLAIRVSDHPVVKTLCRAFGGAIVSTSANLHGQPPLCDYKAVKMMLGKSLDFIINDDVGNLKKPTTIRNALTGEVIRD